jgi:Rieske Fe-S protein
LAERIAIAAARTTEERRDGIDPAGTPGLSDEPSSAGEPLISRRRFVAGSVALLGAGAGAAFTLAACSNEPPGPPASPNAWVPVSIAGLETGVPRWVEFEAPDTTTGTSAVPATPEGTPADSIPQKHGAAWLVKEADGTVVAFYPLCTHQYCICDWETGQTRFHCRCHEGFFSVEGTVLGGPPKKPLYRWLTRPVGSDTIEIGVLVKT